MRSLRSRQNTWGALIIYGVIVTIAFLSVGVSYLLIGLVEEKFGVGWKMKGQLGTRKSNRCTSPRLGPQSEKKLK